jgi:hypothetical protein
VLQGQSEPGEQHPVTEDWKENVLWTDRFDGFQGKCVPWICCLGFRYFRYLYLQILQIMNSILNWIDSEGLTSG